MSNDTVNMLYIDDLLNSYVSIGEIFLKSKNFDKAKRKFEQMTKDFPYDYRGYWGIIRANTYEFSKIGLEFLEENKAMFIQATTVASVQQKDEISPVFEKYKKLAEQTEKEMQKKLEIVSHKEEKIMEDLADISNKIDKKQEIYEKKIRISKLSCCIILFPIIYYAVVKLWSEMDMFPLIPAILMGVIPSIFLAYELSRYVLWFYIRKYKKKLRQIPYEIEKNKEVFLKKFDETNNDAKKIKEEFYAM